MNRIRTLKFNKRQEWKDGFSYSEIADSALTHYILSYCSEHPECVFKKVKFDSCPCKIKIKATKENFLIFVNAFCSFYAKNIIDIEF